MLQVNHFDNAFLFQIELVSGSGKMYTEANSYPNSDFFDKSGDVAAVGSVVSIPVGFLAP